MPHAVYAFSTTHATMSCYNAYALYMLDLHMDVTCTPICIYLVIFQKDTDLY